MFFTSLRMRQGEMTDHLMKKKIAIIGLGGLGSHIALALARSGVMNFVLCDFDVVDDTNIHRQAYFPRHIGMLKTRSLQQLLFELHDKFELTLIEKKIQSSDIHLFSECDLIIEAVDDASVKAELVSSLLRLDKPIIGASGVAGIDSSRFIRTVKRLDHLYLCGDFTSDVEDSPLICARVTLVAMHQALIAIRLLLNLEEPC